MNITYFEKNIMESLENSFQNMKISRRVTFSDDVKVFNTISNQNNHRNSIIDSRDVRNNRLKLRDYMIKNGRKWIEQMVEDESKTFSTIKFHLLKEGENVYSLANTYNISVEKLHNINYGQLFIPGRYYVVVDSNN